MYSLPQLKRGLSHPGLLLREVNRLYYTRFDTRQYNPDGVDIFDEDWDNLFLLDACRFDLFKEHSTLPGNMSSRVSRGSNTVEFLRGNFSGRKLHDTVYVTANPQFRRYQRELEADFHMVIDVWRDDGWDETYGTVLPETTAKYAMEAANEYPDKRILVHFIQPHYPFLDPVSEFDKGHLHMNKGETDDFWHDIFYGRLDIAPEEVWSRYRVTLEKTLPYVADLLEAIEGRSVVTSDHGNMVGERSAPIPIREWGHPQGIHTPALVQVPWLEYQNGPRRQITSEAPEVVGNIDDSSVDERLRHLGYKE